jgi:hypothetical protein
MWIIRFPAWARGDLQGLYWTTDPPRDLGWVEVSVRLDGEEGAGADVYWRRRRWTSTARTNERMFY